MDPLILRAANPSEAAVAALIHTHSELMRASSPAESCHVMPSDELCREGADIIVAQRGGEVLGVGALKEIAPEHGEVKSMHTAAAARGQGIARSVLHGLMDLARQKGMARLSLETGSAEMFAPARALYLSEGFETCPPFADYGEDPLSIFMTRTL